jgi:hypothetical protein
MTTAKIVFASTANTPLFAHYDGQSEPQPAFISLDLTTGEVDADYSGELGSARPADVFHGIKRRYPVRCDLTLDQVTTLLTDILPTLQRVLEGSEVVWNNCNRAGKLNDAALGAEAELTDWNMLGADFDHRVITDLAEWMVESGEGCWLPGDADNIAEFIRVFDLDGFVAGEDVGDTLMELWADRLYNGDPLPANVALALIEDGRCDDSNWTEELQAYAEGRYPA